MSAQIIKPMHVNRIKIGNKQWFDDETVRRAARLLGMVDPTDVIPEPVKKDTDHLTTDEEWDFLQGVRWARKNMRPKEEVNT